MPDTKEMLLRLGHSPDPDDAFMFYGLAKDKFPTGPYRFKHVLQDIQTLNKRAMEGELEITAISIHAYPYVSDRYALTSCGSSMGDQYGPMVIARAGKPGVSKREDHSYSRRTHDGVPVLQLCLGKGEKLGSHPSRTESAVPAFYYEVVHFDQIPAYVRDGKADAGLIIHEGQLTYQTLGLHLVLDTGVWWYKKTGLPLPLGGNCIRKNLGPRVMQEVTDILKRSIQYSLDHRAEAVEYALQFGRDLNRELADKFVGMYVNQWTIDYGPRGREAINRLLKEGAAAGLVPDAGVVEYVTAR